MGLVAAGDGGGAAATRGRHAPPLSGMLVVSTATIMFL